MLQSLQADCNTWSESRLKLLAQIPRELGLVAIELEPHTRTNIAGKVLDHAHRRGLHVLAAKSLDEFSSSHHVSLTLEQMTR